MIEQRSRDACSQALCETLTRALQIECARAVGISPCGNQSRLVAGALEIISSEYSRPLRPRDIAERLGVTPALFADLVVAAFAIVTIATLASGLMFGAFFTAGQFHALRERLHQAAQR